MEMNLSLAEMEIKEVLKAAVADDGRNKQVWENHAIQLLRDIVSQAKTREKNLPHPFIFLSSPAQAVAVVWSIGIDEHRLLVRSDGNVQLLRPASQQDVHEMFFEAGTFGSIVASEVAKQLSGGSNWRGY